MQENNVNKNMFHVIKHGSVLYFHLHRQFILVLDMFYRLYECMLNCGEDSYCKLANYKNSVLKSVPTPDTQLTQPVL